MKGVEADEGRGNDIKLNSSEEEAVWLSLAILLCLIWDVVNCSGRVGTE